MSKLSIALSIFLVAGSVCKAQMPQTRQSPWYFAESTGQHRLVYR